MLAITHDGLRKGQIVRYVPDCGFHTLSARIERVHRDGWVTIKVLYLLNDDGSDSTEYFGDKYRVPPTAVSPRGEA